MSTLTPNQPIVSKSDTRKYRLIKLNSNELEVLLVSDPETDMSSAALNVNVGQLQDPIERQGLAHFLEHMLFLGTKKYPDASQFDQHLSDHAGYSNAYTQLDQTNYYFHCSNKGFKEALDRFAQFFIGPLFTQDLTTREMNAVNSENQKNLQVDAWREYQLLRSTSKPGNVFNKFGTGNLQTLNFPSTRDDLIKFYETYYSSNLMKAVVLSNESLDDLQTLAETLLSDVTNRNLSKPSYVESPFDASNMGKLIKIVPIKTESKLKLMWLLPNYENAYKRNPASLLSRQLGNEGEFSLLSCLMSLGLAENLSTNEQPYMGLFSTLSMSVTLTEKGFKDYLVVLNVIFAYTKLVKEQLNQQWIFDESKVVDAIKFDYKDKEEPIECTYVFSENMQTVGHEDILQTNKGGDKYDPELIQTALDALTLENLRVVLVSPQVAEACNLEEEHYKVKYSIEDLPEAIRDAYNHPVIPEGAKPIGISKKNELLPKNFDLIVSQEGSETSSVANILHNERIEVYHKKDNTFKVPKIALILRFKNNDSGIGTSASAQAHAKLWTNLMNESTRELMYDAEMACLESSLEFMNELTLKVEGFSDSIEAFVRLYFEKLVAFNPEKMRGDFDIQLGKLQKQATNFSKQSPYQQGAVVNEFLLMTRVFSPKQLLEESIKITFESLFEFHTNFLKQVRLELLVHGNITSESTLNIAQIITEHVFDKRSAIPLDKNNIVDRRMVMIGENKVVEYTDKLGDDETNNFICSNYQIQENVTAKSRVQLELLGNFFSEPFFTQLRTTECLGYITWTRYTDMRGVGLIRFIIQSDVQSPQYLSSRITNFLKTQHGKLKNFTQEQFETLKSSVEVSIKEKDVSIQTQAERYFQYIEQHHYQFDLKDRMLDALKDVTLKELQELFERSFINLKRNYQLHLVSPKHWEQNTLLQKVTNPYNNHTVVEDPIAFKVNSSLHPDYFAYRK